MALTSVRMQAGIEKLLNETAQRAALYLEQAQTRQVTPSPTAIEQLKRFREPFPQRSTSAAEVLAQLDEIGSPATVCSAGPRYFGFVVGGSLPAALAANWMAGAWDQNAGFYALSPTAAVLEEVAGEWMKEIFSFPASCGFGFVTSATMANFAGLAAARHRILEKLGWDVESKGLFGAPEIRVIVSDEVHVSVLNALSMLGMGRDRVTRAPVDRQGRIIAGQMPKLDDKSIVCIQAGNVNGGSFDPAETICNQAREAGAWVHVDGAFGLWAAASPAYEHLMKGVAQADSWATDAHKWLNVPYDSGIVFVKDSQALQAAMSSLPAAYLTTTPVREPCYYTPELSRRARGVEVWAALRALGREGLAALIERTCRHAVNFANGLREAGFEVLNDVVLNQVVVSFGDEGRNRRVIEAVQKEGTCWLGPTFWQGRHAARISVSNWATTDDDVKQSLEAIVKAAREL